MARKSLQQLEEEAKKRQLAETKVNQNAYVLNTELPDSNHVFDKRETIDNRAVGDVMRSSQTLIRYRLPEQIASESNTLLPKVRTEDYPEINVRGSFPVERQKRGANLLLLKEIDKILEAVDIGNNRNATLNFLIWVGLQTIKGMTNRIDVKIHEKTFADGGLISEFEDH